jgi:hypothetical protein
MSSKPNTSDVDYTSPTLSSNTPNNLPEPNTSVIASNVYAFTALNGFSTDQTFNKITRLTQTIIDQYDVTGAIEILMDVSLFNSKLGIFKDANNVAIINNGYYDNNNNIFFNNFFSISSEDLISSIKSGKTPESRIVSVGRFSSIYSDFAKYVASYFGVNNAGFDTLFTNDHNFNPNLGIFDASALVMLLTTGTGITDLSGASTSRLSGSIDISNITQLLANAVDSNCFGNRDPDTGNTSSLIDGYGNRRNYGTTDGFFADDLFFIPKGGLTLTLRLGLDDELFGSPQNNKGSDYSLHTGIAQDEAGSFILNASAGIFTSISTSTATSISRTLSIPLLIRLANLGTVYAQSNAISIIPENTYLVAIGGNNSTGRAIYSFDNGLTWNINNAVGINDDVLIPDNPVNSICYNSSSNKFVTTCATNIFYSDDNGEFFIFEGFSGVTYDVRTNGSMYLSFGFYNGITIAYSYDAKTWTNSSNASNFLSTRASTGIYVENRWIAVGYGGTDGNIITSPDGDIWSYNTNMGDQLLTQGFAIAHNGAMYLVGGQLGTETMIYSTDAINWFATTNATSIATKYVYGIGWNGTDQWVAIGVTDSGAGVVMYSSDGKNWTLSMSGSDYMDNFGSPPLTLEYLPDNAVNGTFTLGSVLWSDDTWIIGGCGTISSIIRSKDGINWNAVDNNIFNGRGAGCVQIAAGNKVYSMSQINAFTPYQITSLTTEQISMLLSYQIESFTNVQKAAFTKSQIAKFTDTQNISFTSINIVSNMITSLGNLNYSNIESNLGVNIASSSDGKYLAVCCDAGIYVSSNKGVSFILTPFTPVIYCIAMSSTGQYMCATSTGIPSCNIYVSSDYGVNWKLIINIIDDSRRSWINSICMDKTGQYIFCGGGGGDGLEDYYSNDYGVTFIKVGDVNSNRTTCVMNNTTKTVTSTNTAASKTIMQITLVSDSPVETTTPSDLLELDYRVQTLTSDDNNNINYTNNTKNWAYSEDGGKTFMSGPLLPTAFASILYENSTNMYGFKLQYFKSIYFSRNKGVSWVRLNTPYRIRSFCSNSLGINILSTRGDLYFIAWLV